MDIMKWRRESRAMGVDMNGWLEGKPFPTAEDLKLAFPLHPPDMQALQNPPTGVCQRQRSVVPTCRCVKPH